MNRFRLLSLLLLGLLLTGCGQLSKYLTEDHATPGSRPRQPLVYGVTDIDINELPRAISFHGNLSEVQDVKVINRIAPAVELSGWGYRDSRDFDAISDLSDISTILPEKRLALSTIESPFTLITKTAGGNYAKLIFHWFALDKIRVGWVYNPNGDAQFEYGAVPTPSSRLNLARIVSANVTIYPLTISVHLGCTFPENTERYELTAVFRTASGFVVSPILTSGNTVTFTTERLREIAANPSEIQEVRFNVRLLDKMGQRSPDSAPRILVMPTQSERLTELKRLENNSLIGPKEKANICWEKANILLSEINLTEISSIGITRATEASFNRWVPSSHYPFLNVENRAKLEEVVRLKRSAKTLWLEASLPISDKTSASIRITEIALGLNLIANSNHLLAISSLQYFQDLDFISYDAFAFQQLDHMRSYLRSIESISVARSRQETWYVSTIGITIIDSDPKAESACSDSFSSFQPLARTVACVDLTRLIATGKSYVQINNAIEIGREKYGFVRVVDKRSAAADSFNLTDFVIAELPI